MSQCQQTLIITAFAVASSKTAGISKAIGFRTAHFGIGTKRTRSATQNGIAVPKAAKSRFLMTATKLFERKNFLLVISFSKREYQSLFWGEQNAASYAFGIRG